LFAIVDKTYYAVLRREYVIGQQNLTSAAIFIFSPYYVLHAPNYVLRREYVIGQKI